MLIYRGVIFLKSMCSIPRRCAFCATVVHDLVHSYLHVRWLVPALEIRDGDWGDPSIQSWVISDLGSVRNRDMVTRVDWTSIGITQICFFGANRSLPTTQKYQAPDIRLKHKLRGLCSAWLSKWSEMSRRVAPKH